MICPQTRAAKGFAILSVFFFLLVLPVERIAVREADLVSSSALHLNKLRERLADVLRAASKNGGRRALSPGAVETSRLLLTSAC